MPGLAAAAKEDSPRRNYHILETEIRNMIYPPLFMQYNKTVIKSSAARDSAPCTEYDRTFTVRGNYGDSIRPLFERVLAAMNQADKE